MDNRFVDTILGEVSQEKAEGLGRAGHLLEEGLRELRDFDARGELPAAIRDDSATSI